MNERMERMSERMRVIKSMRATERQREGGRGRDRKRGGEGETERETERDRKSVV